MRVFFYKSLILCLVVGAACTTGRKYHSSAKRKPGHSYRAAGHSSGSSTSSRASSATRIRMADTPEETVRIREADNVSDNVMTVIREARSYTGTPYKWGGTTRAGMDCSGLLCTSFQRIDLNLPRTSAAQSEYGKRVKIDQLRPGDLVFFATGRSRSKVTHVGMVTEVQNGRVKFIHSSSSLGVVENSLDQEYYARRFIIARRPF